jgi:hypothetical protein
VPNPGFEIRTSCIYSGFHSGGAGTLPPWDSPTDGTADGFDTCEVSTSTWVPNNNFGFQYPHSGHGYAGAGMYNSSTTSYYIEYIQVELDSPLVNQENYCASFYINLANLNNVHYTALKNIGMYFSNTHTDSSIVGNLSFTPQITIPTYVTDTLNWTLVYGEYVAHGGERYIIIGNFKSQSASDTIHLSGTGLPGDPYYYIDDVNIHCCTCDSTTSLHAGVAEIKEGNEITIYPNPTSSIFTITSSDKIKEVRVYDILGNLIRNYESGIRNKEATIDISSYANGMYFVEIKTEKGVVRKKVVKQ